MLSIWHVFAATLSSLIIWEIATVLYLAAGFVVVWRSASGRGHRPRAGVQNTLSWVLPWVASGTGINSAVHALIGSAPGAANQTPELVAGVIGIIVSWFLLHAGFAQVYENIESRSAGKALAFPGTPDPALADMAYFSYVVGTAFSTSDTEVRESRARVVVLGHSVVSFLYNALVVAVAFQVLQRLAQA